MSIEDRSVPPVTPGEVLEDILKDCEMNLELFAILSEIPLDDLKAIIVNKKPISQDTARAIGKALGTSDRIWLDLQAKTDNWHKRQ